MKEPAKTLDVIQAKFLGDFEIRVSGQVISGLSTLKSKALLAYLLMEGQKPQPRSVLAATFWPDVPEQTALHNLRQALVLINKAFVSFNMGGELFESSRDSITLHPQVALSVDALDFTAQMEELFKYMDGPPERGYPIQRLNRVLRLFRGEFLPFFSLPDADPFEDWLAMRRESITRLALQGFAWQLQYHENRGEWNAAYGLTQNLIKLAPWDEQAHYRAIRCLLELSQSSAAASHYQNAVHYFQKELDVEPGSSLDAAKHLIDDFQAGKRPQTAKPFPTPDLPHFATPFIGRSREIEVLESWMADPHCNLITLTGPGGSGKTCLAVQMAEQQNSLFKDGVHFASLANCQTRQQIAASVFRSLGMLFERGNDAFEELLEWSLNRKALLVLDNVDNTSEAADFAARLSGHAPQLILLFTAYSRLNLIGEKVFALEGLPLQKGPLEDGPAEAVQLYLSHLQAESLPEFHSPSFLADVNQICDLVDGMPLAIALAAGQTRCMPANELLAEIRRNLDVLRSQSANYPERHRSIQASFENAWNHLSTDRQKFLALLTAFQTPFTAKAAETLFAISSIDLRDLAGESLLTWDASERYRFHRTIWQYAREKSQFSEEEKTVYRQKYAEWFFAKLAVFLTNQDLDHLADNMKEIEGELADSMQALHWFIQSQAWAEVKTMIHALFRYFEGRGLFLAGSDLFKEIAKACAQQQGGLECQVMASSRAALLSLRIQQYKQAAEWIDFAYARARENEWHEETAFCLNVLASQALSASGSHEAEQFAAEALDIAERFEIEEEIAHALYNLGFARINKGEVSRAFEDLTRCRQLCLVLKNWRKLSKVLNSLADIACYRSDLDLAIDYYTQALTIAQGMGNQYSEALIANNIGTVYMEFNEHTPAKEYLNKSIELCQLVFDREGEAVALANLGEIALKDGDLSGSIHYCQHSLEISEKAESNWGEMSARVILAQAYIKLNEIEKARREIASLMKMSLETESLNFFYRGLVEAARLLIATHKTEGLAAILVEAMKSEGMEDLTRSDAQSLLETLQPEASPEDGFSSEYILAFVLERVNT